MAYSNFAPISYSSLIWTLAGPFQSSIAKAPYLTGMAQLLWSIYLGVPLHDYVPFPDIL